MAMPMRPFGRHNDVRISALGFGGHHLGDAAAQLIREAGDGGITFFDNAWEYHAGESERWMGAALKGKRDRVTLMSKVCTTNDPDLIFAPNSAAEALAEAKRQGKVRFVGFTVHKDPSIHLR